MQIKSWQIVIILFLFFLSSILLFFNFNLGIYQSGELGNLQLAITAILLILLGRFNYNLWYHQTEEDMQRQKKQSKVTIFVGILLLIIGIFDPFDFFSTFKLSYPEIFLIRIVPGFMVTVMGFYAFWKKV